MTEAITDQRSASQGAGLGWRLVDLAVAVARGLEGAKKRPGQPFWLVVPAVILIGVLALGIAQMIWMSFHSLDTVTNEQGGLSFSQYQDLLAGPSADVYLATLLRTIITALIVTVTAVTLALPTAYAIVSNRHRMWRRVALLLLLVPFLMGETVRTIGWVLIIGKNGALASFTGFLGHEVKLLGTPAAVWIGMVQVMYPLATLVMMPVMRRIDPDLERAALTMGARPWQVWTRIILPLARDGIVGASLIVLTLSMTEYLMPRILGLGKLPFVANTIQQMYLDRGNLNLGSALSTVLLVVVIAMILSIALLGRKRVPR